MNFLFVHQNFPGQFRYVAKALADDPSNRVVGVGDAKNISGRPVFHPRITVLGYSSSNPDGTETHHYLRDFETHVRRGQNIVRLALHLKAQGFCPDVVVAHPGWGEAMFIRDVFPDARHVSYFEYYYHGVGGDVGFDPEFPSSLDGRLKVRVKNSTQLLSLASCDQGLSPTQWQRQRYPVEFQSKIRVVHEGVDTRGVQPDSGASVDFGGRRFEAGEEIVTYVSRNLEPYRGFHVFMRSLPKLQALRPQANFLIVGGDDVSYGSRLSDGKTYRQLYCEELKDEVDWSRVFFLGKLPYAIYLKVLQVSAVHVYLTYPFVLSWSMLEAMSAGCLLVGSATQPVEEVIRNEENGLLVDFFDADQLAKTVAEALSQPASYQSMRERARQTVIENYDLHTCCLPEMLKFLKQS